MEREIPKSTPGNAASEAAAESMEHAAPRIRRAILEHVRAHGAYGATNPELSEALGRRDVTVWPRVSELVREGKLEESGERLNSATGRACTVYVATTVERELELRQERESNPGRKFSGAISDEAWTASGEVEAIVQAGPLFGGREKIAGRIQRAIDAEIAKIELARRGQSRRGQREAERDAERARRGGGQHA